jgi:hypothetical protein
MNIQKYRTPTLDINVKNLSRQTGTRNFETLTWKFNYRVLCHWKLLNRSHTFLKICLNVVP